MIGAITDARKQDWVRRAAVRAHNARAGQIAQRHGYGPAMLRDSDFVETFRRHNKPCDLGVTHVYVMGPVITDAVQMASHVFDVITRRS